MNGLYICHYCIDYRTHSLSDMIKHYKRKNTCKCSTLFSYEDSNILSRKKYIFNFDNSNLSNDDYLYIITHYKDNTNIINKNFKIKNLNDDNQNNIKNINSISNLNDDNTDLINIFDLPNDLNNLFLKQIFNTLVKKKLLLNNDSSKSDIILLRSRFQMPICRQ